MALDRALRFTNSLFILGAVVFSTSNASAENENRFDKREEDWRNGAIVYQVLVDRFVPSTKLEEKRDLYPPPKVLRDWGEEAKRGVYLEDEKLSSQELDFWGGDLESLSTRIDYIADLGVDAIYLNPIHLGYTNHNYDALDFMKISPEYGTRGDFQRLAGQVHEHGMKLVMDGVFNHMGRNSDRFQDAFSDPDSRWREWFYIGPQYEGGAIVWTGFQNLPELNIENPEVRDYIYIYQLIRADITPALAKEMVDRVIADSGIEPMLKSWTVLDNHDIPRVATDVPEISARRIAQVLQFTLPGSPNIYYGTEVGMQGGGDPENRSPVRWDLVKRDNPELAWVKRLIQLRTQNRALRIGDYRPVISHRLFAFERNTEHALETVVVLANPADAPVTETVLVGNADLMDAMPFTNLLGDSGDDVFTRTSAGTLRVTIPAQSIVVLKPFVPDMGGYNRYKRVD